MARLMPAEWEPHTRTWMSWPPLGGEVQNSGVAAASAWASVANAVVEFEPLTMLVTQDSLGQARQLVDPGITLQVAELDDGWLRDNGPTFVLDDAEGLVAVDWTFNGWGLNVDEFKRDSQTAEFVAGLAGVDVLLSPMVNEGGGIHVDGEGTVIVTETVQLHDKRNPGWSKAQVEAELERTIGATSVIWLTRGLMGDMQEYRPGVGTNGHVDVLAAFVRPGVVVVHGQPDSSHYDHAVMEENVDRLHNARDAKGRQLEIITINAPETLIVDGVALDHSYINFSFVNEGIVMCSFNDLDADERARAQFQTLFPDRRIEMVDARAIFHNGGGVHCITQQQPERRW